MLSLSGIRRGACVGVLAAAFLSGTANAQAAHSTTTSDDAATIKARQIYREGVDAFNRRDFEAARVAFLKTLALKPGQPVVSRNLGLSEIYSGHYLEGARRLARVFHTTKDGTAQDRARMLESLKKAEAHLERLTIEVEVEGAQIDVDGIDLGTSPLKYAWYVAPGTYEVKVSAEGYQPFTERRVANAGVTTHLRVQLAPLTAEAPAEPAPAAEPNGPARPLDDASQGSGAGPNAWVIAGGAAFAVAAGGAGFWWLSEASSANDELDTVRADVAADDELQQVQQCSAATRGATLRGPICNTIDGLEDDVDRNNMLSIVSFGVAGAAAAGTLIYALWPRDETSEQASGLTLDRVSAWPLPGGSALTLTGRF